MCNMHKWSKADAGNDMEKVIFMDMLKSRTFRKTVLSYAVILIIPIFIFFYISIQNIINENYNQLIDMHNADSKRIAAAIDSKLIELNHIGDSLYLSKWVNKLMVNLDSFDEEFNILTKREINKELKNYTAFPGILSNLSIVFPYKDLVVSQNGWYEMDEYFSDILKLGQEDIRKIKTNSMNCGYLQVVGDIGTTTKSTTDDNIVISRNLEINNNPRAVLLFFLKKDYLQAYIKMITLPNLQNLAIVYEDAEIYDSDLGKRDSDKDPLSFAKASEVLPWKYVCTYNNTNLPVNMAQLLPLYVSISLSLLAGTVVALLLAIRWCRPLYNLFNNIFKHDAPPAVPARKAFFEYHAIETSFGRLVDKNQEMANRMRDYESTARNSLLLQLLKGYFDDARLSQKLKEVGIPYQNDFCYCVILINIGYGKEDRPKDIFLRKQSVINSLMIAEQIIENYRTNYEIVDVLDDTFALILSFDQTNDEVDGNKAFLETVFAEIKREIEKTCNINIIMAMGNLEKGVIGISKSYQMARDSMEYIRFGADDSRSFPNILNGELYYYPTDWQIQLINNLKIGDSDTVARIMDEIKLENERRDLPKESLIRLVSVIMETQLRVLDELNMDTKPYQEDFEKAMTSGDMESVWRYLYEVKDRICRRNQFTNTASHSELVNRIIDYIDQNYNNPDLSLKELADLFDMPLSSLSKLLKEVTGVTYYDYLSRSRLEKAKLLLRDTNKNINVIAREVGYENEQSFRRAFKRYEGITPSGYLQAESRH